MKTILNKFKTQLKDENVKQSVKYVISFMLVFVLALLGVNKMYFADVLTAGIVGLVVLSTTLMMVSNWSFKSLDK